MTSDSALATSIQSRLPRTLQPLCSLASPDIPALEQTCHKLLSATGASSSGDRLSQLISRDLGLTCRILQVANSLAYRPQQPITSVPHAISWLGLDTVRHVIDTVPRLEHLAATPTRHQTVAGALARALASAVHAIEFGMALEYPSQTQLFSLTLLYAIGDICIANYDPDLYHALRRIPQTVKTPADRAAKELALLGVPKLRLTQALAMMWSLPAELIDLISARPEPVTDRWPTSDHVLRGLVRGSSAFVSATTNTADPVTITRLKRTLLVGSGLPDDQCADLLVRAMDRSQQLVRSVGLSLDAWDEHAPTATIPLVSPGLSAIETAPEQAIQTLEKALQQAKDVNALLDCFVHGLHRDGGFARVALALLHPKSADQLVGRVMLGVRDRVPYLSTLSGSLSLDHPFFQHVLNQPDVVLVEDFTTPLDEPIDPAFLHVWNPGSAIIAPIRVGTRPVGLVICDQGPLPQELRQDDLRIFNLFYTPTLLSLNRLAAAA